MTTPGQDRIIIAALRAAHPIEQVIAASGVQLHPRGHGYIGCCPFHDDTTPSLSVGGVPERFNCFAYGAGGDVIDFVARLHHLSFVDGVHALEEGSITPTAIPARGPCEWCHRWRRRSPRSRATVPTTSTCWPGITTPPMWPPPSPTAICALTAAWT